MATRFSVDNNLKRNWLNITDSRKKILEIFKIYDKALLHSDIERKAGEKFDRVTVKFYQCAES